MKKLFYMSALGLLILVTLVQCKKKEDTPASIYYTAGYQLQITGGYTDLKIEYYETGLQKKVISNPALPWQVSFSNFVKGDSLKLDIRFLTVNGTAYNYTGGLTVNQGSFGMMDGSESNPIGAQPVYDQLTYKIP